MTNSYFVKIYLDREDKEISKSSTKIDDNYLKI